MRGSTGKRRLACIFTIFFFFTEFLFSQTKGAEVLLVIHSYNIEYKWTEDIQRGILDAVSASEKPYLICTEF